MTRRQMLSLSALAMSSAPRTSAQMQAVAPQGVKALARANFSGKPYDTNFVNVASQAAWWDSAKIVHASGVRAVVKARCSRPPRKRIIARWRRTISRSLILLDNLSG